MLPHPDNAAAFATAITALRLELAVLERRAAETRQLIDALCEHAGIAPEQAAPPGEATATTNASPRPSPSTPAAPKKVDDQASADELKKVAATIAELSAEVQTATREKNAAKLMLAIEAFSCAERTAGALLAAMGGRVKLPITKQQAKRFRRAADLNDAEFESKLRRAQHRAIAASGVGPETPAPAKAKPSPRPEQAMKISDWREEPDGSRSRTVTAVDGGGAETL